MSYEEHAEGVRDDYREALEGLTMNTRVEINNLTLIARENTEFAFVIADVLQEHIKKVPAARKLPAMYLLDSIVKNVGSPYTHFFAKNLYSTFMETYASVDDQIRRKMDEMLRTWKEPIPGSVDTRPVFPIESTRPIENALIKARSSALQAHYENSRHQQKLMGRPGVDPRRPGPPVQQPYRETPTPPGGRNGPFPGAFPPQGQPQHPVPNGNQYGAPPFNPQQPQQQQAYPPNPQFPGRSTPQPPQSAPASTPFPPPAYPPHGAAAPGAQPGLSIASLTGDIERLIDLTRAEFARNVHDTSIQTRLKALLDLQGLLKSQNVQPDHLMLIKNQIDALSVNIMHGPPKAETFTPTPPTSSNPYPPPPAVPQPVATPVAPPASAPPAVTLDSLLGKGASSGLAAFLSRGSATPQGPAQAVAPPPVIPHHAAPPRPVSAVAGGNVGVTPPAAAGIPDAMSVVAMLKAKGLLPPVPAAGVPQPSGTPPVVPIMAPTPVSLAGGLAGIIAQATKAAPARQPLQDVNGIQLNAASLKRFRPHLVPVVYDDLGAPCTQCGRRFKTDEKGRARKTAHMDWHFRVHRRMTESEKRGQHRSWYTDSNDWIRSRESVDTDHAQTSPDGTSSGNPSSAQAGKQKAAQKWIPVPSGGAAANSACPICQEQFEMKWLDEAQEWVWMDAVNVKVPGGVKVYHASCHEEATRAAVAEATPDRVLGKRKAEDGHAFRGKMKEEGR